MVLPIEIESKSITLEEFLEIPETQPPSEYIDGKIHQKPMPQGKHSRIQTGLSAAINQISESQKLALALTELRCTFGNRSLVPDIAVFEWKNIPLDDAQEIMNSFNIPPDWVIEILSPQQSPNSVINKIIFCLNHGTKLGWFIDPEDRSVMIFQPNKLPEIKYGEERLPALEILTDWQLKVTDLFSLLKIT